MCRATYNPYDLFMLFETLNLLFRYAKQTQMSKNVPNRKIKVKIKSRLTHLFFEKSVRESNNFFFCLTIKILFFEG